MQVVTCIHGIRKVILRCQQCRRVVVYPSTQTGSFIPLSVDVQGASLHLLFKVYLNFGIPNRPASSGQCGIGMSKISFAETRRYRNKKTQIVTEPTALKAV
jgi:hypothetical protein